MSITVKELKDNLKDIPDDAIVYVYADHGQTAEQAGFFNVTSDNELEYYGEEIDWDGKIDLDSKNITAIMIS